MIAKQHKILAKPHIVMLHFNKTHQILMRFLLLFFKFGLNKKNKIMKNLLHVFLLAVFMLFVVNAFAIQPSTNYKTKAQQIQVQTAPAFNITTPLHKADEGKSQTIALVLALVSLLALAGFPLHLYYLGYKKKATWRLILWIIGILSALFIVGAIILLVLWILALIDTIKILSGDLKPANGDYTETL